MRFRIPSPPCCLLTLFGLCLTAPVPHAGAQEIQTARAVLDKAPPRGLCVLVGVDDPQTIVEVAKARELLLYAQVADERHLRAARQAADQAGVLGRVVIDQGGADRIGLGRDLADVVFVFGKTKGDKIRDEVLRVLHPGGVAYLGGDKLVKPFPRDTDDWSHPYHGPDNNPQSEDQRARGPFLTQFLAEPWYASMPQMSVISGGRIFKVFGNRTSKQPQWPVINTMMCLNAFNGTTLWARPLPDGFMLHRNTLIATPETLYFGDARSCQLIDPATGKVRDEIVAPADLCDGPVWCWMALEGGVLYALVGKKESSLPQVKEGVYRGAGWPWWRYPNYDFGFGRTILAIDPTTKKILWHHHEDEYLDMRAMCMAGGKIFFYSHQKFLGCLDAKTGNVVWKTADSNLMKAIGEHAKAQFPLAGYETTSYVKASDKALFFAGPTRENLLGVSATDGKLLWEMAGGNSQLVLRDDGLYALGGGRINEKLTSYKLDPISGKVLATFPSRDRCTRATGCVDAIFTRGGKGGSTSVFDVTSDTPKMGVISPMRPACQDGVTIAHGYLFWGPWMCRCDFTQIGVIALGPSGDFDHGAGAGEQERLQTFAADLQRVQPLETASTDWPTFRADNARRARTGRTIPIKAEALWTFKPSNDNVPTAPIAAGDLIVVGGSDGAVRALDAATGEPRWTAYTGGGIKYPPAVADGRVYVGSGDGRVYCVEAATGKPLWRFQAAPEIRRIPVFGSLLSTWPVGAGVVVDKGVVYAAAGNANYDGTHVYALDAVTGKVKWENHTSGHQVTDEGSGAGVQGHLLLHGGKLYLAGGNLTGVVSYDLKDGTCHRVGHGVGKDFFVLGNEVHASGLPLYFRPEDSHYIEKAGVETPAGVVAIYQDRIGLADSRSDPQGNLKALWTAKPFQENNAVAVAKNAVLIAGVDRQGSGDEVKTSAGVCAVKLDDGEVLWRQALPAAPTGWGVAVDARGRVVVSLQDGRVVCLGAH